VNQAKTAEVKTLKLKLSKGEGAKVKKLRLKLRTHMKKLCSRPRQEWRRGGQETARPTEHDDRREKGDATAGEAKTQL